MSQACPYCGGRWVQIEKDTSSGQEIREFKCEACGRSEIERRGPALWQVLSDARKRHDALAELSEPLAALFPDKDIDALLTAGDAHLIAALAGMLERSDGPRWFAALTLLEQAGESASLPLTRLAQEQVRLILDPATPPRDRERAKSRFGVLNIEIRTPLLEGAIRTAALEKEGRGELLAFAEDLLRISPELRHSYADPIVRGCAVAALDRLAKEREGRFVAAAERVRKAGSLPPPSRLVRARRALVRWLRRFRG